MDGLKKAEWMLQIALLAIVGGAIAMDVDSYKGKLYLLREAAGLLPTPEPTPEPEPPECRDWGFAQAAAEEFLASNGAGYLCCLRTVEFAACMNGPNKLPAPPAGVALWVCAALDADGDDDVDLRDFAERQRVR